MGTGGDDVRSGGGRLNKDNSDIISIFGREQSITGLARSGQRLVGELHFLWKIIIGLSIAGIISD